MILIIDYGMSNLGSIRRAIEECGGNVIISSDYRDLGKASKIVLPGVGSFATGMKNLQARDLIEPLKVEVLNNGIPILGICLGMQLLATTGYEGGVNNGLNLINGTVERFVPTSNKERIPHVGWNSVNLKEECNLFHEVNNGHDFYFVHSYHFVPLYQEDVAATTTYITKFVAAVHRGCIYGTQFHPEKSVPLGLKIIKNFIDLC